MTASYWCQPQTVKCLLEYGCDVNIKNKDGRTALHEACRSRSKNENNVEDVVRYLVNFGAQVNDKSSAEGEVCENKRIAINNLTGSCSIIISFTN